MWCPKCDIDVDPRRTFDEAAFFKTAAVCGVVALIVSVMGLPLLGLPAGVGAVVLIAFRGLVEAPKACPKCGLLLTNPMGASAYSSTLDADASSKRGFCPVCKKMSSPTADFCPSCGSAVRKPGCCRNCAFDNDWHSEFCARCGQRLTTTQR